MKLVLALRAGLAQAIDRLLVFVDSRQQKSVVLLACQEFVHDLLHVAVASARADLLEGLLKMTVLVHFLLHFLHQELAVQFLDHVVFHEALLVLVIVVLLSRLGDLHLSLVAVLSLLERVILVLDRLLERYDTSLSGFLLVVNIFHELHETSLAL